MSRIPWNGKSAARRRPRVATRASTITALCAGGFLVAAGPAGAWQSFIATPGAGAAVAVDAANDVLAAGSAPAAAGGTDLVVAKLDSLSGASLWSIDLGAGAASGLTTDSTGDVVVAARLGGGNAVAVIWLASADGSEKWRARKVQSRLPDGRAVPFGRALNGDVYFAATQKKPNGALRSTVSRLARDTGALIWQAKLGGSPLLSLTVDLHGDVLLVLGVPGDSSAALVKLDHSTGKALWSKTLALDPSAAIATTPTGDVVVGGQAPSSPDPGQARVWLFDGATGNERWHQAIGSGSDVRVAATSSGDVVATANVSVSIPSSGGLGPQTVLGIAAVRLMGPTGQSVWSKTISDPAVVDCGASALALDGSGAPILAGCATQSSTSDVKFELVKLKPDTGALLWRRSLDGSLGAPVSSVLPVQGLAFDQIGNVASAGLVADPGGSPAFAVIKWGLPSADDLLLPADRACRQAITNAGENYSTTRIRAIEACHDVINSGQLLISPDACPTDPPTRRTIGRAATDARKSIAKSCAATLPSGVACAATLDDLISADGSAGCLIDTGNAATQQLLAAAYPTPLAGAPSGVVSCQVAIGTAARRLVNAVLASLGDCEAGGTPTVGICAADPVYLAAVAKAANSARSRIKGKCSSTELVAVAACGTTLDDLVAPTLDSGCLLTSHRAAAEAIATALGG